MAASDPSNSGWQRDVFVSHAKLGDIREKEGDEATALQHYRRGLKIVRRLVERDPTTAVLRSDLEWVRSRIAGLEHSADEIVDEDEDAG